LTLTNCCGDWRLHICYKYYKYKIITNEAWFKFWGRHLIDFSFVKLLVNMILGIQVVRGHEQIVLEMILSGPLNSIESAEDIALEMRMKEAS
jgi:hypothetical protein